MFVPVSSCLDLTLPVNQYKVTVQRTEASRRCQLDGEYLVSLGKQAVMLLAIGTGHVIYRWPYMLIRKFGQCKVRCLKIKRNGEDTRVNSECPAIVMLHLETEVTRCVSIASLAVTAGWIQH